MALEDKPEEDEARMRGITVGGSRWCSLAGLTEMSALEEVSPRPRLLCQASIPVLRVLLKINSNGCGDGRCG